MSRRLFRVAVKATVSALVYVMAEDGDEASLRVEAISPVELLQAPRRAVAIFVDGPEVASMTRVTADGWAAEPPYYPHAEHRVYAGADTCAEILVEQESIAAAEREAVAP